MRPDTPDTRDVGAVLFGDKGVVSEHPKRLSAPVVRGETVLRYKVNGSAEMTEHALVRAGSGDSRCGASPPQSAKGRSLPASQALPPRSASDRAMTRTGARTRPPLVLPGADYERDKLQ